eukprot:1140631-Pelagomonas_calceolata.AAC.6
MQTGIDGVVVDIDGVVKMHACMQASWAPVLCAQHPLAVYRMSGKQRSVDVIKVRWRCMP